MPDSNLSTSIAAIRSKILADAPTATIDDILSLARAAKSIGLTEDTTIETALNSRIQTLSSGATTAEMAKLSNAIKQVRDISGGVGSTTTDDIVEGSTNKFLHKTALTTQLSDLGGHILPDTTEIYDLGSTTNKFRDLYLSGNTLNIGDQTISADGATISMDTIKLGSGNNTVTLEVDSSGDFQRTSVKNGVTQPTSPIVGSSNDLSDVDLTVQPEVLELQVADPTAGHGAAWQWTWEQSSLPYARATITNQTQPSVALYMQGTYTINNFANTAYGAMTQTHDFKLKWIEGSGDQNLVSWAAYSTIDDTHPDINGGTTTSVQRLAVNVPTTITPPSLTAPAVSYNVSNGVGAYAFTGGANGNNPSIGPFYRGGTYTIDISATGHPFYFTTDNGTNFAAGTYFGEYTTGVTGSRNETGTITFTVPAGAPDTLYYQCGNHAGMRGSITVKDLAVETNANGNYIIYGQHDKEGHAQPMELRPIPSLVNQMCLVYDGTNNKWVPQDMATYVENTPAFENKIKEVAGTATLVAPDGTSLVASVNIYSDATYLPAAGNTVGDIAFAEDTQKLYIYKNTTIGWIETVAATNLTGYATESYVNTYVADNAGGSNTLEYTSTQSASPHDVMMLNSDGTVTPVSPTSYSAVFNDSNKYAFGNQSGGQGNFGGTGRVALNPTNRTESVLFSDTPNGTDMHGYVITSGAISGSINSFDSVSITPASYLGHWYNPYDATKLYIFMTFGSQYNVRVIECSVAVSGLTWVSTTDTGARTQNWNSSLQYNHAESADGDVRWILSTANTNECKAQQIKYDGSSWTTITAGSGAFGATLDTSSNGVTSTKYDGELSIAWSKTVSGLFVKANGLVLQSGKIDWTTGSVTLASPQAIYWSASAYGTTGDTSHYPALDISENNRVAVIYKNDTSWALVNFAVMDLNTSTYGLSQNGYGQTLVSAPNGNSGMPLDVCFPIGSNYGAISYAQSGAYDSNIKTTKAMVNLNGSGATYAITDTYFQNQDDGFLSIAKFQACPIQKGHMSLFTKRMTQVNSGFNSYYYGDPEIHYYVLPYADSNLDKTKIIGMSNSTGTTVDVTPEHALHVGLSGLSANSTYYVLDDGSISTVADTNDAKLGTALNSTTISLDFTEAVVASNLATYATKTYVDNQITSLVDSSPDALNTLNELAAAMGDDASFSTTITNSIATKLSTTDFTTTANAWAGTIGTHLLPDTDITYDLGSATHRFRDLYLDGNTIDLGGQTIKSTATGIEVSEIKIGTGTNSVKLTADADGKLTTTETDSSGTTGAAAGVGGGGAFEELTLGTLVSKYHYDLGNSGTGLTGGYNFIMGQDTANAGFNGYNNFAFGRYSMANVTDLIQHNFAFGRDTMRDASGTTHDNFAFGESALMNMSGTNGNNIAMGWMAQQECTSGYYNIGLGPQAGKHNQTAVYNIFIGPEAGRYATAGWNIGIGIGAGGGTGAAGITGTTGTGNVSVGSYAARALSSGAKNTSLGYNANNTLQTGTGNTSIGQEAMTSSVVSSNQFTLGASNITNLRCNDTSISSLSDERDKTNIQDTTLGLDFIKDIRPVDFTWDRRDGTMGSMKDVGFIAQELWDTELKHSSAHRTRMVQFDNPDKLEAAPNRMFPVLVKAVQELAAKNEELEARLAVLEGN